MRLNLDYMSDGKSDDTLKIHNRLEHRESPHICPEQICLKALP